MIAAIIFSKDRACQLDLLLRGVLQNGRGMFVPTVLYTASMPEFQRGYDLLMRRCGLEVMFLREKDFCSDVVGIAEQNWTDFLVCFTDDGILYRRLPVSEEEILHQLADDTICFSLRIGKNTMLERYWEGKEVEDFKYSEFADFIKWNQKDYSGSTHFGYPFSLDGHVFRREEILGYLKQLGHFSGPNDLEGALATFRKEARPNMVALKESVLVVNPVNRVQDVCKNVNGWFFGATPQELNERYLAGEIIDFDRMDFSSVVGTHQEFRLPFKRA